MTADPYQASGGPSSPQSWNPYAYTRGDPVNRVDPSGTDDWSVTVVGTYSPLDYQSFTSGDGYYSSSWIAGLVQEGVSEAGQYAAAAHITPLTAPGTSQNQQQALDAGIDSAWAHLLSNPNCAGFLSGNQVPGQYFANLSQLSTTLNNTTYTFGSLPSGTAAHTNQDGGNEVTINTSGAFFSQPVLGTVVNVILPDPGLGLPAGVLFSNIATFDAMLLLHELGHETGVLPAEGDDETQNGANSVAILNNCFTKGANGVYQ